MDTDPSAGHERDFQQYCRCFKDAVVFRGLSDPDLVKLIGLMVCDQFAADEVIIRQDTVTRNLWLLSEGECEVIKQPPLGEFGAPVPLAVLKPMDVFGEMTLFSDTPHVASVEARSHVRTLRLRGEDFDRLAEEQPRLTSQLACNLVHILSERMRGVDQKLSTCLTGHEDPQLTSDWMELRNRLGRLYAGTPVP